MTAALATGCAGIPCRRRKRGFASVRRRLRSPVVMTLPSSPAAKAYVALWERVRDTLDSLP